MSSSHYLSKDVPRKVVFITNVLRIQRYRGISNSRGLSRVYSPWQVPLPLFEATASRVVVYFYNSRWIPIAFSTLADAITLHRNASCVGKELVVFPCDLDPESFFELSKSDRFPSSLQDSFDQSLSDEVQQEARSGSI